MAPTATTMAHDDGDADQHHGRHSGGRSERAAQRRQEIERLLRTSGAPIVPADLARQVGSSRQVVGRDIEVLRAGGIAIITTPRGYLLRGAPPSVSPGHDVLQVRHDRAAIADELGVLVDLGLRVHDECVEHPVLGRLCGPLFIASRRDARAYAERLEQTGSGPLLELTGGRHSHTVEAPRPDLLEVARQELRRRGYLVEDAPRAQTRSTDGR